MTILVNETFLPLLISFFVYILVALSHIYAAVKLPAVGKIEFRQRLIFFFFFLRKDSRPNTNKYNRKHILLTNATLLPKKFGRFLFVTRVSKK